MLGQHRRQWPNIKPTLGEALVLGMALILQATCAIRLRVRSLSYRDVACSASDRSAERDSQKT